MTDKILYEVLGRLCMLQVSINHLITKQEDLMSKVDDLTNQVVTLTAAVEAEGTVVGSAVTALNGMTAQQAILNQELADAIAANEAAKNDPAIGAAVDALTAQNDAIVSQTAALAAAIPANTAAAKLV